MNLESLPDRRLAESEVEKLRDSDLFQEIKIQGRYMDPRLDDITVESVIVTLESGKQKDLFYGSDGWEVLEDIADE